MRRVNKSINKQKDTTINVAYNTRSKVQIPDDRSRKRRKLQRDKLRNAEYNSFLQTLYQPPVPSAQEEQDPDFVINPSDVSVNERGYDSQRDRVSQSELRDLGCSIANIAAQPIPEEISNQNKNKILPKAVETPYRIPIHYEHRKAVKDQLKQVL